MLLPPDSKMKGKSIEFHPVMATHKHSTLLSLNFPPNQTQQTEPPFPPHLYDSPPEEASSRFVDAIFFPLPRLAQPKTMPLLGENATEEHDASSSQSASPEPQRRSTTPSPSETTTDSETRNGNGVSTASSLLANGSRSLGNQSHLPFARGVDTIVVSSPNPLVDNRPRTPHPSPSVLLSPVDDAAGGAGGAAIVDRLLRLRTEARTPPHLIDRSTAFVGGQATTMGPLRLLSDGYQETSSMIPAPVRPRAQTLPDRSSRSHQVNGLGISPPVTPPNSVAPPPLHSRPLLDISPSPSDSPVEMGGPVRDPGYYGRGGPSSVIQPSDAPQPPSVPDYGPSSPAADAPQPTQPQHNARMTAFLRGRTTTIQGPFSPQANDRPTAAGRLIPQREAPPPPRPRHTSRYYNGPLHHVSPSRGRGTNGHRTPPGRQDGLSRPIRDEDEPLPSANSRELQPPLPPSGPVSETSSSQGDGYGTLQRGFPLPGHESSVPQLPPPPPPVHLRPEPQPDSQTRLIRRLAAVLNSNDNSASVSQPSGSRVAPLQQGDDLERPEHAPTSSFDYPSEPGQHSHDSSSQTSPSSVSPRDEYYESPNSTTSFQTQVLCSEEMEYQSSEPPSTPEGSGDQTPQQPPSSHDDGSQTPRQSSTARDPDAGAPQPSSGQPSGDAVEEKESGAEGSSAGQSQRPSGQSSGGTAESTPFATPSSHASG
ncbi:hypothetical protein XA68_10136 [Ophiocordyceps unilateralis]|uniref:Uncharacterized protein n=1 Tax=Ophiocordyceps unilateralis TaxID=268505 RepID=A0A2A9PIM7_OPHUN|nr:hypothetical protein XA68_10136 [Ophiocordyceps unilateralis]